MPTAKIINELIENTFYDDDLQSYIDDVTSDLIINGSKVGPKDFIRDYASSVGKITDSQLRSLNPELIDSLIESGYFMTDEGINQTFILNDKQKLRVARLRIKNDYILICINM